MAVGSRPYELVAVVKNGNSKSGYFVCNLGDLDKSYIFKVPWNLVSANDFKQIVAQNQVRNLCLKGDTIKCEFSEDKNYEFYDKRTDSFVRSEAYEYWSKISTFSEKHIYVSRNSNALAVSWNAVPHLGYVSCYIYGQVSLSRQLIESYCNCFNAVEAQEVRSAVESNNFCTLFLDRVSRVDLLLKSLSSFNVLSNTSSLTKVVDDRTKKNATVINAAEYGKLINGLNSLTAKTERKLGI